MYGQIVIGNRLPFGRKPGPSSLSLPDLKSIVGENECKSLASA